MRTEQEIRERLADTEDWLDQFEGEGAAEEGVQTGWAQALAWALGEEEDW